MYLTKVEWGWRVDLCWWCCAVLSGGNNDMKDEKESRELDRGSGTMYAGD